MIFGHYSNVVQRRKHCEVSVWYVAEIEFSHIYVPIILTVACNAAVVFCIGIMKQATAVLDYCSLFWTMQRSLSKK